MVTWALYLACKNVKKLGPYLFFNLKKKDTIKYIIGIYIAKL